MRFLLVDDDESIILFLKRILEPHADCLAVDDGEKALAAFTESLRRNEPFTAVFMDILMPGMDGNQAVRELRTLERRHAAKDDPPVKLIMISVCTDTKNVSDSFFQGLADAYLPKPLDPDVVLRELSRIGLVRPSGAPGSDDLA